MVQRTVKEGGLLRDGGLRVDAWVVDFDGLSESEGIAVTLKGDVDVDEVEATEERRIKVEDYLVVGN